MDDEFLSRWADDVVTMSRAALLDFEQRFGFPPGEHRIGPPAPADDLAAVADLLLRLGLPDDLLRLYRTTSEVSLPDIGNGLFINHARHLRAAEPTAVLYDGGRHDVVVFAADGGGTSYALPAPSGVPVLRLPPGEITPDGCYTGRHIGRPGAYGPAAADLADFLDRLRAAVARSAADGGVVDL